MGTGHVLRARRLLTELAKLKACEALLAMADDPIGLRLAEGLPAEIVTTGPLNAASGKPLFDPRSLAAVLDNRPFDVVVVDMLDTPDRSLAALRKHARRIVTFDDRGPGRLDADAIINVLVRDPEPAALPAGVRLVEGPQYATLDPIYAEPVPQRVTRETELTALVTLGGADTTGLTPKVIRALRDVHGIASVSVVCGIGSAWHDEISAAAAQAPWHLTIHRQVPALRDLFLEADIAFVAGGLTMHEACCTGTPSVAVCQPIDHQPELAAWFADQGAMATVGDATRADERLIADMARRLVEDPALRTSMGEAGRNLVDGMGTGRTAQLIVELTGDHMEEPG